jgi:membrane protease YdiL (CAAX protease family)
MAPVLRPRTFFAAILCACVFLPISAVALLSRNPYLFPLTDLPRAVVAAQTVLALILLPLLFHRFRKEDRLSALLLDSLVAFAVSIPFVVLSALVSLLNLRSVITSQFLYLAMILLGTTLATWTLGEFGISLYLMTVFLLIAAVPLSDEIIAQFRAPLDLSALSPVALSIQSVSDQNASLPTLAVACLCLAVAAILWRSISLQMKVDKNL